MALLLERTVFFHIPKTGGQWVARALEKAGVVTSEAGPVHADPDEVAADPGVAERSGFTFVRHPLSWYASMWAHRTDEDWEPMDDLDWFTPAWVHRWAEFSAVSRADSFDRFVRQIIDHYPAGFVSELYEAYTAACSHIGSQESLADDLVRILAELGEDFDEASLRASPDRNVRASSGRRRRQSVYTRELAAEVMHAEAAAAETYGYTAIPQWVAGAWN